jgi:hypothetical protein
MPKQSMRWCKKKSLTYAERVVEEQERVVARLGVDRLIELRLRDLNARKTKELDEAKHWRKSLGTSFNATRYAAAWSTRGRCTVMHLTPENQHEHQGPRITTGLALTAESRIRVTHRRSRAQQADRAYHNASLPDAPHVLERQRLSTRRRQKPQQAGLRAG